MRKIIVVLILAISFLFVSVSCFAQEPVYEDGTYKGTHSFITVSVEIKNNVISDVQMVEHGGGGKEYAEKVKPLIERILDKQSTQVDAITGATRSSDNLKKAVNKALGKACIKNCTLLPSE